MYLISHGSFRFAFFLAFLLAFAFGTAAVANDDHSRLLEERVVIDLNQLQQETAQSDMPVRLTTRLNKRLERVKSEMEAGVRTIWRGREAKALSHFQRALIHINHYQAMLSEQVAAGEVSEAVTNSLSVAVANLVQIIEQLIHNDWQDATPVDDYAICQFAQQEKRLE